MKQRLLVTLITLSTQLFAQRVIPAGTVLPVQLNSSLRSDQARVGEEFRGRIMQDVPLQGGSKIHSGVKVIGHVVSVTQPSQGKEAEISFRFDALEIGKRRVAMTTNLRALATMMDVSEAQVPESGPDRGTSENEWTTDQIGGEVVYGGGVVAAGSDIVGKSLLGRGVLVHVRSRPGTKCRGEIAGNDQLQALWVFSSDACGVYDFPNLTLTHAGRTDPVGQITPISSKGNVRVPGGSGLLLRVNGTAP